MAQFIARLALRYWPNVARLAAAPTGEARLTKGYQLKARYVIHTVGPYYEGREQDAEQLSNAYRNSLELASQHSLKTIAFPAISTGIYGYPLKRPRRSRFKQLKSALSNILRSSWFGLSYGMKLHLKPISAQRASFLWRKQIIYYELQSAICNPRRKA